MRDGESAHMPPMRSIMRSVQSTNFKFTLESILAAVLITQHARILGVRNSIFAVFEPKMITRFPANASEDKNNKWKTNTCGNFLND